MADRDENKAQLCDICHRRPAALRVTVAPDAANVLAERLARAYDPEPRRRPAVVKIWAEEVAAALDGA